MKQITIGIYDQDPVYSKRLMEYLNHQEEYPMKAISFHSMESLLAYEKEHNFHGVLLAEGESYGDQEPVLRLGDGKNQTVKRYGNALEIARELYRLLGIKTNQKRQLIAVYSPITREEQTDFALSLTKQLGGIYVGCKSYNSLNVSTQPTEELLFYIKERREDIIDFFLSEATLYEDIYVYGSALCFLDYRELTLEDYTWFFEQLRTHDVSVVFDYDTGTIYDLRIFDLFDSVFLYLKEEDKEQKIYQSFQEMLEKETQVFATNMKEAPMEE